MTQEEDLLLKDLSTRIFYGTIVKVSNVWDEDKEIEKDIEDVLYCVLPDGYINTSTIDSDIPIKDVKPYLRPMSSMTEEELKEFRSFHCVYDLHPDFHPMMCNMPNLTNMFDWLNAHHIDYRGLIPKGLAIEAPDGMYNINE